MPRKLEINARTLEQLPNFRLATLPRQLLYRSGYIERLSEEGMQQLGRTVSCVVDMRGREEMQKTLADSCVTSVFEQRLLQPGDSVDGRTQSGRRRYTIDLLGRSFYRSLFTRQPLVRQLRFALDALMALPTGDKQYQVEFAKELLLPRGLRGLNEDVVDFCRAEIAAVLRLLTDANNLPCLLHCFLGKDRTGIVVMLLQWLLGVPRATIVHEYQLSKELNQDVAQEAIDYYADKDLPKSFTDCQAEDIELLMQHIEAKYGGVEPYLIGCGLTQAELRALRTNFGAGARDAA